MKTIKKTWPFEIYDFNIINKYINDMANKGYALGKIGSLFATYEKTEPREYKYAVDYVNLNDMVADNIDEYKKKWIDEGWEFVDFYDQLLFFRCKYHSNCRTLFINQRKVIEDIFSRVKKFEKDKWLRALITMTLYIASAIFVTKLRNVWIVLAMIQFFSLFSFFRFLNFRKNNSQDTFVSYNSQLSKKYISILNIIKWSEETINVSLLFILSYLMIFINKSYFFAKLMIVLIVIVIGFIIYSRVKEVNKHRKNKFDFESGKGKLLILSMGTLVTIGVISSFILIDQSKPKYDCVRNIPCLQLECSDRVYYIPYDYGNWNYQSSYGIGYKSEREFLLPRVSDINKLELDNNVNKSMKILFSQAPNEMEVRYWEKKDFEAVENYNEEYKTLEIEDGVFKAVDEEVVYVVYAKWQRETYDGVGYYVFSE